MATFNKIDTFVLDLTQGVHTLATDVLKVMLTNIAPVATNTVKANLTDITAGNGYTAGGPVITVTSSTQTSGTYSLVLVDNTITATGGTIGPFRYVALYNDTSATDNLIGWYDYGSSITLADAESFKVDFAANAITLV